MKIIILPSDDKQWYFVVTARNNQPILTSETYTRRSNAVKAARKIIAGINKNTPIVYGEAR